MVMRCYICLWLTVSSIPSSLLGPCKGAGDVKEHVRNNNKLFTVAEIQQLTRAGIQAVIPDVWQKYVVHVRGVEDRFLEQDGLIEQESVLQLTNSTP